MNNSKKKLRDIVFSSLVFLIGCTNGNRNNIFDPSIESFRLVGTEQIIEKEGDSIVIYVPYETDISNIGTDIRMSNKATINPTSGVSMNFSTPREYTVKAKDGSKNKIWLTVKKSPWRKVIENGKAPFFKVDGHSLVVFKDKMWLLSGWLGKYDNDKATYTSDGVRNYWTSQVWCTSDGINWESKGNAPWHGRHGFGCVVHDDKLWVIGGDQHTDVWNTDDGVHWNKITKKVPWGERYFPYIVSFKGKIWVMGGIHIDFSDGNKMGEKYNDIWSTKDGVHWNREVEFAKWAPRGLVSGTAILNDELYIYGGCILNSYAYDDVWKTSDGINWTKVINHAPWPSRTWSSIISFDNKLWIMAGDSDVEKELLNDVWYSSDGVFWTQQKGIFWLPRHATSVVEFNNKLWMVGGLISQPADNWGDVSNDVWVME
ncbi:kelch repeat-containing protein [Petrimonas sp.]|uniref:kelch repeat-containing protein n=1 Tax=Petrimonas sp. TaxID=2023866 RepID=UPI002FC7FB72